MNGVAASQRLLIGLWVLLAAAPAKGTSLLRVSDGALRTRFPFDMWCVEQSDWRARAAYLNTFPQFRTSIDGLGIPFLCVRSPHEHALPLVMTHGG